MMNNSPQKNLKYIFNTVFASELKQSNLNKLLISSTVLILAFAMGSVQFTDPQYASNDIVVKWILPIGAVASFAWMVPLLILSTRLVKSPIQGNSPWAHIAHVMSKVFLYIFLPCVLVTIVLVVTALLARQ